MFNTRPRIVVVGAGAVGSVLGGLLTRAGQDVTLIGREAHVHAINERGLRVDGVLGEFNVDVKATKKLDFRPDLALLTVKAQDVELACREIKPHVEGVPVTTLQNGIISDKVAASIFGRDNIVSCVVCFNAQFLEPGRVTCGSKGTLIVGKAFGENGKQVAEISALLNKAIKTEICDNIQGARWTKLFMNILANSLNAMTGLNSSEYIKHSGLQKIGVLILKEALSAVEKASIKLEALPEFPLFPFKVLVKAPLPVASVLLRFVIQSRRDTDAVTSTLQSIRRGRPTEIDYLNGEIVKLGQKIGVPTPYNSKVVALVREVEKTQRFYSLPDLERHFSTGLQGVK